MRYFFLKQGQPEAKVIFEKSNMAAASKPDVIINPISGGHTKRAGGANVSRMPIGSSPYYYSRVFDINWPVMWKHGGQSVYKKRQPQKIDADYIRLLRELSYALMF